MERYDFIKEIMRASEGRYTTPTDDEVNNQIDLESDNNLEFNQFNYE